MDLLTTVVGDDYTPTQLKGLLAYFPGEIAIHDPIAELMSATGEFTDFLRNPNYDVRDELARRVEYLIDFRPLVESSDLLLLPAYYPNHDISINQDIQPFIRARVQDERRKDGSKFDEGMATAYAEMFGTQLRVAALLGHTPVPVDVAAKQYILESALDAAVPSIPGIHQTAARLLSEFEVPGFVSVPFREFARVRANEAAFGEFRSAFASLLRVVGELRLDGPAGFQMELQQAAEDILRPQVAALARHRRESGALQQLLGGSLAIGGAVLEYHITSAPPVGTLISALMAESSWLLWKLATRLSRQQRTEQLVSEFLCYLVPTV
jgi:hypothetical protein